MFFCTPAMIYSKPHFDCINYVNLYYKFKATFFQLQKQKKRKKSSLCLVSILLKKRKEKITANNNAYWKFTG